MTQEGTARPQLQALVLADHIYQDVTTGKKVIAGTFNKVLVHNVPALQEQDLPGGKKRQVYAGGMHGGSPYAYISLTDVCDGTELLLQFVNLTKNRVLFGKKLVIECKDRLGTVEIVAPLPLLPITEGGTYAFEVLWAGEILGSHRILAEEISK